ncbi:MAG: mismatch repair protein MutS [Candidatus Dependentiae bacterium]|nr:mismatch repair protein MutS [Candidatus Dependentiae bacterium]
MKTTFLCMMLLLSVSVCHSNAVETVLAEKQLDPQVEALAKGRRRLQSFLNLHRTGVPYDYSIHDLWDRNDSSWNGWITNMLRQIEQMPACNLHRDAIDIFARSEFLAKECIPSDFLVCDGTQVLQDLEVLGGKVGSETAYLAHALSIARSSFGKVSTVLLLANPQLDEKVLCRRQEALRALLHQENGQLCDRLHSLYDELVTTERYFFPVVNVDQGYNASRDTVPGLLIMQIPFLKKLWQSSPSVRSFDHWYNHFMDFTSYKRTVFELSMLGLYSYYAFREKNDNAIIVGNHLSYDDSRVITTGKYYMPFDVAYIWDKIKSNKVKSALIFYTMLHGIKNFYNRMKRKAEDFRYKQFEWKKLARASRGFAVMHEIYRSIAGVPCLRALPDCAPVYDFFEKHIKEDDELAELYRLFEGLPLNEKKGTSFFSGYIDRANHLLKIKAAALSDLAVGIGRVEVYLGFAQLIKKGEQEPNSNRYTFATYATAEEPAVFHATGLWNPFLTADKAVPSDVSLGGYLPIRNYLITGPNAAGKSTVLKQIGIGALLAQTVGIVPAQSCHMSIFAAIETYLNITDDIQKSNSLFKKEVMRANELLKRAVEADGKPVLLIFDEMFSGTSPHEGISCAYATVSRIAQMSNVLSCVATHFKYLTKLAQKYPCIANKCVRLDPIRGGNGYVRTYRLYDGISNQHVALDMLGEEGVDNAIVKQARDILRDVEENGISA